MLYASIDLFDCYTPVHIHTSGLFSIVPFFLWPRKRNNEEIASFSALRQYAYSTDITNRTRCLYIYIRGPSNPNLSPLSPRNITGPTPRPTPKPRVSWAPTQTARCFRNNAALLRNRIKAATMTIISRSISTAAKFSRSASPSSAAFGTRVTAGAAGRLPRLRYEK